MPSLLSLPSEIRNGIFELVLYNPQGAIDPRPFRAYNVKDPARRYVLNASVCPWLQHRNSGSRSIEVPRAEVCALLVVNPQIRQEASPLFFSLNTWCLRSPLSSHGNMLEADRLRRLVISAFGSQLMHLTSVETDIGQVDVHHPAVNSAPLRCLRVFRYAPLLKNLYVTISLSSCETQELLEEVILGHIRSNIGIRPTITIEPTYCSHCDAELHSSVPRFLDREWWLWRSVAGEKTWETIKRKGQEAIDEIGAAIRGRADPGPAKNLEAKSTGEAWSSQFQEQVKKYASVRYSHRLSQRARVLGVGLGKKDEMAT